MPSQATKLVDEAIIQVLSHGGCFDQGRAFVLYAKCLVASASTTAPNVRKLNLQNAVKALSKAKDLFNKVEAFSRVKITLYLQSFLHYELDAKAERNRCAFEYRELDLQFPTKANILNAY